MKLQDILRGKMLPGNEDLRCATCKNFTPRNDGTKAGYCRIHYQSLFYDDWVCIDWEDK